MAQVNPIVAWPRAWQSRKGRKAHALLVEEMYYQLVMVARLFDAEVNHQTAAARLSSKNERREGGVHSQRRPLAGTASCLEGRAVRTNWSPPPGVWPNRLARIRLGHVVDRRRSGEPRTREHHRHLTGVRSSGEKSTPAAGMFYAARCKAIDEQDDIVPGDKLIGQPSLRRVMHPSTAVQSDDRGKQRPRAWPDSLVCGRPQ